MLFRGLKLVVNAADQYWENILAGHVRKMILVLFKNICLSALRNNWHLIRESSRASSLDFFLSLGEFIANSILLSDDCIGITNVTGSLTTPFRQVQLRPHFNVQSLCASDDFEVNFIGKIDRIFESFHLSKLSDIRKSYRCLAPCFHLQDFHPRPVTKLKLFRCNLSCSFRSLCATISQGIRAVGSFGLCI